MKSKLIIIILAVVIIVGGVVGYLLLSKKGGDETAAEPAKDPKEKYISEEWNPYAADKHFQTTLTDILQSAVGGEYVIKMNVTIAFKDQESYEKFQGATKPSYLDEDKKEDSGHESEEGEAHLSPLDIKTRSLINTFLMDADGELIKDKTKLQNELKAYLNKQIDLGEEFVKEILIENYIIQ